ncbi:unnamed protein product, partial [Sphenostylis stenocarpa]
MNSALNVEVVKLGGQISALRVEGDDKLRERLAHAKEENKIISSLHELKVVPKVTAEKELAEIKDYVVQEHIEGFNKVIRQMHYFTGSSVSLSEAKFDV